MQVHTIVDLLSVEGEGVGDLGDDNLGVVDLALNGLLYNNLLLGLLILRPHLPTHTHDN